MIKNNESKMFLFIYLMASIRFCSSNQTERNIQLKRGILIFPGLLGNSLYVDRAVPNCYLWSNRIWLPEDGIFPRPLKCFFEILKLRYNSTGDTVSDALVPVSISKDFGSTQDMEKLTTFLGVRAVKVYGNLVKALVKAGFEKKKSIFGISFDWRKSVVDTPDEYYGKVKDVVLQAYKSNNNITVNLVCHSNGCINMANFAIKMGSQFMHGHVNTIISLGAPWGGAVKALKASLTGDSFGFTWPTILSQRIAQQLRPMTNTFTSLIHLFPAPNAFSDKLIMRRWENQTYENYTAETMKNVFHQSWNKHITERRHDITDYFDGLLNVTQNNKKICIFGKGRKTLEYLLYDYKYISPHESFGDGDGTVNIMSLEYCVNKTGVHNKVVNSDHVDIVDNKNVQQLIIDESVVNVPN